MKRITLLLFMLAGVTAFAQKQEKPNVNKALTAWKDGKLDEAKRIIDMATTYEKTMNDGQTWYYRGLIYASLDTTQNATYQALATDPLKTAIESFNKADELGKAGKDYVLVLNTGIATKTIQIEQLANYYLDKGLKKLQEEDDYEGSLGFLDKSRVVYEGQMKTYSNDTLLYYLLGLSNRYAEHFEPAIENFNKYFEKGGKSRDAFVMLYQIYNDHLENKEKALEVVRQAKAKLPNNTDFPKLEIGLLIDLNKIDDARINLENAIKADPTNYTYHYYLGYVNRQLNNLEASRKNFNDALKNNPNYFEAQYELATTYLIDVEKTTKEINALGISQADTKKKPALVQKRVKESEVALPYLEKAEKMVTKDTNKEVEIELYQRLSLLYYYIADDKNSDRVAKKLKALGVED
jgi:tetratricopeptide (TPR) repeat protein